MNNPAIAKLGNQRSIQ